MTTNERRATTLVRALRAAIDGDRRSLGELCTDDLRAWTPALSTGSLRELIDELDRRDDAFSDIELDVEPLDVGGDYACVEWSVAMTHTGPLAVTGDARIEPTGLRITFHGVTVAEFRGERICSLRQYWDEFEVLAQLGLPGGVGELSRPPGAPPPPPDRALSHEDRLPPQRPKARAQLGCDRARRCAS